MELRRERWECAPECARLDSVRSISQALFLPRATLSVTAFFLSKPLACPQSVKISQFKALLSQTLRGRIAETDSLHEDFVPEREQASSANYISIRSRPPGYIEQRHGIFEVERGLSLDLNSPQLSVAHIEQLPAAMERSGIAVR